MTPATMVTAATATHAGTARHTRLRHGDIPFHPLLIQRLIQRFYLFCDGINFCAVQRAGGEQRVVLITFGRQLLAQCAGLRVVIISDFLGCGLLQKAAVKIMPRTEKFKNSTVELIFCMLLLVYSVMLMVSSTYSAFIYMNF